MKYPYIVIHEGIWYSAGEEVPGTDSGKVKSEDVTKEEIESMKYFSLKSLAEKNGISTEGKNAKVLKKEVIEALGL